MNKHLLAWPISIAFMTFLFVIQTTHAASNLPELKKTGISVDLYSQKLDLQVTDITASITGITPELLETFKPKLNTTNKIDVYGLRLDYQLNDAVNIFGSLGKVKEKTIVDFSNVNAALSDLELDKKGSVYSVGAVYTKHFDPLFASVTVVHSRIDLDDNPHVIKVSGLIPTLGMKTRIGVLTGSLLYQEVDAVFSGEIATPFDPAVPVEVSATNDKDIQVLVGLRTRLAKDFYLNASAGVNGQENYQIQLNRRF
jgi:hypothetical protein